MAELATQPVVGRPVRTPRRMRRGAWLPIVSFALLLGVWEIAVDSGFLESIGVPVYVIPAPSAIVARLLSDPGYILWHSAFTGGAALAGFALALLGGGVLAILLTYSRPLERALYPYLIITKVVPIVAVAPVLAIWFGFGITPKIVVAFLIAFFPIVVNLILGLRSPERGMIMLMRSMNAREVDTFRKIRLPFALPLLFAACRVAAPTTVIGAIVAEFVGSDVGLGYVITTAKGYLHADTMFLALFASSFLGIAMFLAVVLVESRVLRWHESQG